MKISSLSNEKRKFLQKLKQKKYRLRENLFLVEGFRLCQDLFASNKPIQYFVYSKELLKHEKGQDFLVQAEKRSIITWETTYDNICLLGSTESPQPLIAYCPIFSYTFPNNFTHAKRILVLENISDPGNTGTLIRCAEAFGWDGVALTGDCVDIYSPKVIRSSMGSIFRIPVVCIKKDTLLSFFEDNNISLFVSTLQGKDWKNNDPLPNKIALVMGSEAHGVTTELINHASHNVRIPIAKTVESLNVSTAGSILLFLMR